MEEQNNDDGDDGNNSNNDHNSSSERTEHYQLETERREQLAPNCQHGSPQKTPLNEKATAPLFHHLPLVSLCFFLLCSSSSPVWRLTALCHRARLPWQFQHSVSVSFRRRRQRWVCTPPPQTLLHSVYFCSSLSSRRTIPVLAIKRRKWGHAFIRQQLWVYPSLSYIAEEMQHLVPPLSVTLRVSVAQQEWI